MAREPERGALYDDRWNPQACGSIEVVESPLEWTGLYDQAGRKLFHERAPLGFKIPRKR